MTSSGLPGLSQEQTGPYGLDIRRRKQPRDVWRLRHGRLKACAKASETPDRGRHYQSPPSILFVTSHVVTRKL